jgi:hypothetical protein
MKIVKSLLSAVVDRITGAFQQQWLALDTLWMIDLLCVLSPQIIKRVDTMHIF